MQTILGAGGPVGNAMAKELVQKNIPVRLVSRRPVAVQGTAQWKGADLRVPEQVLEATKNSSVIYLCAGLRYDKKVWADEWPLVMGNVMEAARRTGAKLVFFDNVYMYGRVEGPMKEDTPYRPVSRKGEIRARIAEKLMEEAKRGNLTAVIARAADFYGAESLNSFLDSMVLSKYAIRAKAAWIGDPAKLHSFTYVPDAARATLMLGADPRGNNRIWHLPTAKPMSGTAFLQAAAEAYGVSPAYTRINRMMMRMAGLFNPLIREPIEMYYQYQYHYHFDSGSFEQEFGNKPTEYASGLGWLKERKA